MGFGDCELFRGAPTLARRFLGDHNVSTTLNESLEAQGANRQGRPVAASRPTPGEGVGSQS